jgi:threonine/homoserine/homoserine lactone efflux protein
MLEYIIIGSGLAFSAAIQPGPLQAFLVSSVAKRGWLRTLPASLAPLLSDGPIALLVMLVLNRVPRTAGRFLQAAGGILLLYLAWASYRQWKQQGGSAPVRSAASLSPPCGRRGWATHGRDDTWRLERPAVGIEPVPNLCATVDLDHAASSSNWLWR